MKRKKITAAVLFAVSGVLLTGFAVKTCVDGANYSRTVNGVPFTLHIAVNALFLFTPSAITSGAALFTLWKTRPLGIVTAVLWAIAIVTVLVTMLGYRNMGGLIDSLLYALPFTLAAVVNTILTIISRRRLSKTET